jgi:hypothetical protein
MPDNQGKVGVVAATMEYGLHVKAAVVVEYVYLVPVARAFDD